MAASLSPRRLNTLAAIAVGLAAVGMVVPLLGLPAFLTVLLVSIVVEGRRRWIVGGIGGLFATVSFLRFMLLYAAPNVIIAGQLAVEAKAVDRLREIRWAELESRKGDKGAKTFQTLAALLQAQLLDASHYKPTESPIVFHCDSYAVLIYVPSAAGGWTADPAQADPVRSQTTFRAYAWPMGEKRAGNRLFFIDQDAQICQAREAGPFVGVLHPPPADLATGRGATCTGAFGPWKKKQGKPWTP